MSPILRQAFFFAVLIAVPVASFFFVFKPQNAEIAQARKEIEHKQAHLKQLREATRQTEDLQRANEEIRESIQAIEQRLPTGKEMDDVLRQVSQIAGRSGLQLPVFRKSNQPLPAGLAMEQPIEVEINGDFDGFYEFLLELERLPRITRIPDLTIERVEDENADGRMTAEFTLSIYYQGGSDR